MYYTLIQLISLTFKKVYKHNPRAIPHLTYKYNNKSIHFYFLLVQKDIAGKIDLGNPEFHCNNQK